MKNTNFPIGDFLIRIKNAAMAKNKTLDVAANKQILALSESLKKAGYLSEVKKEKDVIHISMAFKNKKPVVTNIKLVSKPGLRVYMGVSEIEAKKGPSTFIISTPKGVVSSREAIKMRMGGEVIAEIW